MRKYYCFIGSDKNRLLNLYLLCWIWAYVWGENALLLSVTVAATLLLLPQFEHVNVAHVMCTTVFFYSFINLRKIPCQRVCMYICTIYICTNNTKQNKKNTKIDSNCRSDSAIVNSRVSIMIVLFGLREAITLPNGRPLLITLLSQFPSWAVNFHRARGKWISPHISHQNTIQVKFCEIIPEWFGQFHNPIGKSVAINK